MVWFSGNWYCHVLTLSEGENVKPLWLIILNEVKALIHVQGKNLNLRAVIHIVTCSNSISPPLRSRREVGIIKAAVENWVKMGIVLHEEFY